MVRLNASRRLNLRFVKVWSLKIMLRKFFFKVDRRREKIGYKVKLNKWDLVGISSIEYKLYLLFQD